MKKFLSLVLALIMTMSLVTISAGATEYKDLTDKDEIQYEEAVAVLNRIGVITGYDDGSFRPETELTRGAAAKIIVSLLIGPEAASNLPNTYAPYPDVPANHTFAGVISYCKTAGIISGYGDGTFKPANSLTGYAFAKMLLGAIGYDSKIQGYTDTGWTMNVARDGNKAGLFNRIEFDGAASVNREQACQLALNTLKATMVEYSGGLNVTAGDAHVTSNPTITYKVSNQEYASHINNKKLNTTGNVETSNHWTVEFGEEHFKDLRMSHDRTTNDKFGRPSNEWSFKKVTIGTFPIEPDFVYTELKIHNDDAKVTDAAKVRALELNGYELKEDDTKESEPVDTTLWLNGQAWSGTDLATKNAKDYNHYLQTVGDIADYTDNGTRVEVYVDDDDADFIRDVVVIKTQLMEVKSLKNEAVALKLYDDGSDDNYMGFNSTAINEDVNDVQINDDCYDTLKDMKVGDIVAVIPVYTGIDSKYDVSRVYVPETVSGELTNVDTYGQSTTEGETEAAIAATVGGTDYKVALWNKDLTDITGTKIRVTRKDVTLHLDEYGNALLAEDVGATSNFMVVGGYHSGLVDGKVVTFVDGWDIKGNEISLNVGNMKYDTIWAKDIIGELVHYSSDSHSKYAEWEIDYLGVFDVASKRPTDDGTETEKYNLKASSGRVLLNDWTATGNDKAGADMRTKAKTNDEAAGYDPALTKNIDVDDGGVKVIYVTMDTDDNEVDSIEIKDGMQAISNEEILGPAKSFVHKRAQACVALKGDDDQVRYTDSTVKAIVIKQESGSANLKDLVYISNYVGSAGVAAGKDSASKPVYGYEAHFIGNSDYDKAVTIYSYKDLKRGDFARARLAAEAPTEVKNVTEENFYNLTKYGDTVGAASEKLHKALSVLPTAQIEKVLSNNKTLLKLMNYDSASKVALLAAAEKVATNVAGQANISLNLNDISDLDLGDESAASIVSINKARFIDLTDNDVDSASDLKELWNDVTDAQKDAGYHRLINLTLLFNDKYDDDGFRDVHAVIITSAPKSAVYKVKDGGPEAGKLTIKDTDPTGIDGEVTPAAGSTLKAGDKITLTVKSGYEAEAPIADATVVVDGLKYTFTVTEKGAKDGVTITIKKAAAGSVVVASTATDRYGAKVLTVKDGTTGTALNPTNGTVLFYAQATAPEWVELAGTNIADADIKSITYTIYHDGTPVASEKLTMNGNVTSASGRNFTLTGTTTAAVGFTGTAKIEITDIVYANAKVRYYANEKADANLIATKDYGTNAVTKLSGDKTSPAATQTWIFSVATSAYEKSGAANPQGKDVSITGVLKADDDKAYTTGQGTASLIADAATNKYINDGTGVYADSKGYVEVVIPGLTKKAPTYSIAVDGDTLTAGGLFNATTGEAGTGVALSNFTGTDTADASTTLKLTLDRVTAIKGTDTVTLSAQLDKAPAGKYYNYKVEVKINGKWVGGDLDATPADKVIATFQLTDDVELTKDDIRFTGYEKLAVKSASWVGNALTITFNKNVKSDDNSTATAITGATYTWTQVNAGANAGGNPTKLNTVEFGEKTLKLVFDKDLAAGNTVAIAADKLVADEKDYPATAYCAATTLTLGENGAVTLP